MNLISLIADQELTAPVVVLKRRDALVADHCAVEGRVEAVASEEAVDGLVDHGRVEAFAADRAHREHAAVVEPDHAIEASAHDMVRYERVDGYACANKAKNDRLKQLIASRLNTYR